MVGLVVLSLVLGLVVLLFLVVLAFGFVFISNVIKPATIEYAFFLFDENFFVDVFCQISWKNQF